MSCVRVGKGGRSGVIGAQQGVPPSRTLSGLAAMWDRVGKDGTDALLKITAPRPPLSLRR
jgi:hypothetical protein